MKIQFSPWVTGITGRMGPITIRRCGDEFVGSLSPSRSSKPLTPRQIAQKEKFKRAVAYAQSAVRDPDLLRCYQAKGQREKIAAYAVALRDFLRPPVISQIDLTTYHGVPGDTIRVHAKDDVSVVAVEVIICTASGTLIERGFARDAGGSWWYQATTEVQPGSQATVKAIATDLPGHAGEREEVFMR
jgi:hypothetical protein